MQGTTVENKSQKKQMDFFSLFLVVVVIISVLLAVVVYRQSFDSGLSVEPNNWSAFGSYMGGVFGPLISFLTLLAILKTIRLQKELLDTQRTEFESMQALQLKAIEAQLSQIQQSNIESERRVIEEYRISLLRALDNCTAGVRSEYQDKRQRVDTLFQWSVTGVAKTSKEALEAGLDNLKRYERRLALMMLLYGEICCDDFESVASMKEYYDEELSKIWKSQPIESEEFEI